MLYSRPASPPTSASGLVSVNSLFSPASYCPHPPESSLGLQVDYVTSLLNTLQNLCIAFRIKPKFLTMVYKAPTYLSSHTAHYPPNPHLGNPEFSWSPALPCPGWLWVVTAASFSALVYLAEFHSCFLRLRGWVGLLLYVPYTGSPYLTPSCSADGLTSHFFEEWERFTPYQIYNSVTLSVSFFPPVTVVKVSHPHPMWTLLLMLRTSSPPLLKDSCFYSLLSL